MKTRGNASSGVLGGRGIGCDWEGSSRLCAMNRPWRPHPACPLLLTADAEPEAEVCGNSDEIRHPAVENDWSLWDANCARTRMTLLAAKVPGVGFEVVWSSEELLDQLVFIHPRPLFEHGGTPGASHLGIHEPLFVKPR